MERKFGILPYNSSRIGNGFLVATDFGSWCSLSEEEFYLLNHWKIKKGLYKKLEKNGILIDKDNIGRVITEYRNLNRFLFQGPSLHIIVPSLRCNQECIYCHAKPPDGETPDMDRETAIKVLNFVFQTESPAITIEFQGGEPLLAWDIVKFIVREAKRINDEYEKKDLRMTLVTNLTTMDMDKLDFLIKNRVSICASLDGPEEVHNANRKYLNGGKTYRDVVKWIEKIREEYRKLGVDMKLHALPTITRHSLPYWKEIIDEYVKQGFDTIHLKFLNRLGAAGENWGKIAYTPEEFIRFWERSMNHIIGLNRKGVKIVENMARVMLTKILLKKDYGLTELMSPCGAGRTQLLYNYNGDIFTCDEGRMLGNELFKLGNVNRNSYRDIMRSEKIIGICHSSILNNYCQGCVYKSYCGTCPVINFAEQGTLVPKIRETMRCKIYKAQFTYLFNRITKDSKILEIFRGWVHEGKDKAKAA